MGVPDPLVTACRYARTLRHLRPVQWYGRLAQQRPVRVPTTAPGARLCLWSGPPAFADWRPPQVANGWYRNQNRARPLDTPSFWAARGLPRLWAYQLHYHDFLNTAPLPTPELARDLMAAWFRAQPCGARPGWEPYPVSRRLLNWAKWLARGHAAPAWLPASMTVQARWLCRRLEHHLMGNHLLANGVALVAAGLALDGREASRFRRRGERILRGELPEQTLADGTHFELSPMYHCLVLEDLLDLLALYRARGDAPPPALAPTAEAMLVALSRLVHEDETIGLFNDATFGESAPPAALRQQAARLGLAPPGPPAPGFDFGAASGFGRYRGEGFTVLVDAGAPGPDYLPGHAHCDALSFELSDVRGVILGNTGTSTYEVGPRRQLERGTAAHATVHVEGREQSEVWAGFRVARRAPVAVEAVGAETLTASHDGFRPAGPRHRRTFRFGVRGLRIIDELPGGRGAARFHLRPGLRVRVEGTRAWIGDAQGPRLSCAFDGASGVTVERYRAARGFNRTETAWVLSVTFADRVEALLALPGGERPSCASCC